MSDTLYQAPELWEFFQAIRSFEHPANRETGEPIGEDRPPERESVRLRGSVSLDYPMSELNAARPARRSEDRGNRTRRHPPELEATFFGLLGTQGVMPQHYTSLIVARLREKDDTLRSFLDLIQHRSLSYFYRAWAKYRLPISRERGAATRSNEDAVTEVVRSLVGLGQRSLRSALEIDERIPLHFAGHTAARIPRPNALAALLESQFELPTKVESFCGRWMRLDESERTRLTNDPFDRGTFNRLGETAILGDRVWDVQSGFRLSVGPVDLKTFKRLMPSGDLLRPLSHLTRFRVGLEYRFEVQVVVRGEEVPGCRLGGPEQDATRLGWNSWLLSRPRHSDAGDAVFVAQE